MSQETLNLPNLQVVNALRIVWLQILGKDDIAHVLFLDLVGFTTLKAAKQRLFLGKLQEIVRATEDFVLPGSTTILWPYPHHLFSKRRAKFVRRASSTACRAGSRPS